MTNPESHPQTPTPEEVRSLKDALLEYIRTMPSALQQKYRQGIHADDVDVLSDLARAVDGASVHISQEDFAEGAKHAELRDKLLSLIASIRGG